MFWLTYTKAMAIEILFHIVGCSSYVPNCPKVIEKVSELWCAPGCKRHGQFGVHWAFICLNKFRSDLCYGNWQQISNPPKSTIYIFWYVTLYYILSCHIWSQTDIILYHMNWHDDSIRTRYSKSYSLVTARFPIDF